MFELRSECLDARRGSVAVCRPAIVVPMAVSASSTNGFGVNARKPPVRDGLWVNAEKPSRQGWPFWCF